MPQALPPALVVDVGAADVSVADADGVPSVGVDVALVVVPGDEVGDGPGGVHPARSASAPSAAADATRTGNRVTAAAP